MQFEIDPFVSSDEVPMGQTGHETLDYVAIRFEIGQHEYTFRVTDLEALGFSLPKSGEFDTPTIHE